MPVGQLQPAGLPGRSDVLTVAIDAALFDESKRGLEVGRNVCTVDVGQLNAQVRKAGRQDEVLRVVVDGDDPGWGTHKSSIANCFNCLQQRLPRAQLRTW